MDKLLLGLGGVALVALLLFVCVLLSTLGGIASGWIVGLFFSDLILKFFTALGLHGFQMWQIGGCLGFLGSFFRSSNTNNCKG